MASLKEIAAELGVSYSLVSKVVNGRLGTTGVSAATRALIMNKVAETGFELNRFAVALKSGRKGMIAVFLHKMGTPGSDLDTKFLKGLVKACEDSDLRLWLRFFETDEEFLAACDGRLAREVDGLIIAGAEHPELVAELRKIDKGGLPVVSCFSSQPLCVSPTNIAIDYQAQCYLPTKHLLETGSQRIAHFKKLEPRFLGYIAAHRESGLPVWPRLVIEVDSFETEDGVRGTEILLASGEKFDAIVAASDALAVGAIKELRRRGIRVPEDVRVSGVDDSPLAETYDVTVTSTTAEMDECGRIAVEIMLKKILGQPFELVVIQPKLIIRDSTR